MIAVTVPIMFGVSVVLFMISVGMIHMVLRSSRGRMLFFVAFICMVWCTAIACFSDRAIDDTLRSYMPMVFYTASLFLPSLLVMFANTYRKKSLNPMLLYALLLVPVSFSATWLFPEVAVLRSVNTENLTVVLNTGAYLLYTLYFVACAMFSARVFYQNARNVNLPKKYRTTNARILIFWSVAGALGSISNLWLPWLGDYSWIRIGPILTLVFVPILFFAATADEYLSVWKTVVKGVLGTISIVAVGWCSFDLLKILMDSGVDSFVVLCIALVFALTLSLLLISINKLVASKLDSQGYSEPAILGKIANITAETHEPREFFRAVRHTLDKAFGVAWVDIVVFAQDMAKHVNYSVVGETLVRQVGLGGHKTVYRGDVQHKGDYDMLMAHNIEVVVPIIGVVDGKAVGALVLTPRRRRYDQHYGETLERIASILSPFVQSSVYYEEILGMNDKMKNEIARKTRKLRQNNQELHKLDDMKSDLLTITTHNLRTPLTGMVGFADMLLDARTGKLSETQRSYVSAIVRSGNAMSQVISDMLDVAHIDAGDLTLRKEKFNLSELVKTEMAMLEETAARKGKELTYTADDKPIKIHGDPGRLKQVVLNLVENAIFYGKKNIAVSLRWTGKCIEFLVKDDGIGVPKDEQKKIFDKMYRASNAETKRPDGTGVGLFVVKGVVEASGGDVIFESEEGKGSTFGFVLKCKKER